MKITKLNYSVITLDEKLLLPAGSELTVNSLDELIATNKETSYQTCSFLEHGTVYKDMLSFLQKPPYRHKNQG